jgi:hypothetical protein
MISGKDTGHVQKEGDKKEDEEPLGELSSSFFNFSVFRNSFSIINKADFPK